MQTAFIMLDIRSSPRFVSVIAPIIVLYKCIFYDLNQFHFVLQTFHQYWPNKQERMTCDTIKVKQLKVEYLDEVTVRTLKVIDSKVCERFIV